MFSDKYKESLCYELNGRLYIIYVKEYRKVTQLIIIVNYLTKFCIERPELKRFL